MVNMFKKFDAEKFINDVLNDEEGLTEKEIVWKRISEPQRKVHQIDISGLSRHQLQKVINRIEELNDSR